MKKRVTYIVLEPDEGNWLTQVSLNEGEDRVFSELVYCPQDQEDLWQEVTDEYKTEWEGSHANDLSDAT